MWQSGTGVLRELGTNSGRKSNQLESPFEGGMHLFTLLSKTEGNGHIDFISRYLFPLVRSAQ